MTQTSSESFESRPHGTGELLALTLQFVVHNLGPVMGITLIVLGPILLISLINSGISLAQLPNNITAQANLDQSTSGQSVLLSIVSGCFSLIVFGLSFLQPWMQGALTHNLIERLLGRTPSTGNSYRAVRPRFWSLWGSTVLAQIIIGIPLIVVYFGAIFAISGLVIGITGTNSSDNSSSVVAGVLLAICAPVTIAGIVFSLAMAINFLFRIPVIVAEGADGIQALGRSHKLMSGNRWRMFLRMAIIYIIQAIFILGPAMAIVSLTVWAAFSASNSGQPPQISGGMIAMFILLLLLSIVVQMIMTPIGIIYVGLNYLDMRVRNENLNLQAPVTPAQAIIRPVSVQPIGVNLGYAPVPPIPTTTTAPIPTNTSNIYGGFAGEPTSPGQKIGLLFNRIRVEGQNADLLNDLGLAYMEVGDLGGALDAFTRARQLNPNDADIAYNLLLLHLSRKDTGAARSTMQDYLRLETNAVDLERVRNDPRFKELL